MTVTENDNLRSTGSLVLNLGCGFKTSPLCVNLDHSFYLRLSSSRILRLVATPFLSTERRERLASIDRSIVVHDMRSNLPFAEKSVDAIYHSHMLEHIDREKVPKFLSEIRRVLRPNGIHRICVPNLEYLTRTYLKNLDSGNASFHDQLISDLYEQCVRKRSAAIDSRSFVGWIESLVVGDARRRGETHQWMYDKLNLTQLLIDAGFSNVRVSSWNESAIARWQEMGLEVDASGREYKENSLYIESTRA